MRSRSGLIVGFLFGIGASTFFGHVFWVRAQQTERPGCSVDHPIDLPKDLAGLSIRNPRIKVIHTTDPALAGGSMYLQTVDPFLGYVWGRSLFQRNFRDRDGVYGEAGKLDGLLLPDGATRMMDRGHASSCGACHNVPYRDAGAGMTISKNGGSGRNSPHLFGGGLIEMIGEHMRLSALAQADENRDGWISADEAKGKRCSIETGAGALINYGSFDDADGNGFPDLNPVFYPVFVDEHGKRIAFANNLRFPGVAGYTVQVQAFGFGHLYMPFRPPAPTTLRAFSSVPFDIHAGMQACDSTTSHCPDGSALAMVSNAGMQQFITEAPRDRGGAKSATGISLDDPDRDGFLEEISEGELDVVEWYLLNHPSPTRGKVTPGIQRGESTFAKIGCAVCHTPNWSLPPAGTLLLPSPPASGGEGPGVRGDKAPSPPAPLPQSRERGEYRAVGDRRFFDLQVNHYDETERLEGKLVWLADKKNDRWIPRQGPVTVRGVFSDFKYHDVGPEFYQMQFDGTMVRQWRTTPLWGLGSTGPYGHDGANLDLDSVIRRHGGEALESKSKYVDLRPRERTELLEFLNNLVLFQTDQLPCDLDGDGKISERFFVQGQDTGPERFNPEWLFRVPGKIEGPIVSVRGDSIVSQAFTNNREAFGLTLPYLKDADGDGFPDVIDPAPFQTGYRDGIR
jgi:hypothetical protein